MSFVVHSPGAYSLLVDQGRPRTRSLGVPVGGAADRRSFALGNALVGNALDAVALEFALAGPTLEATEAHACVVAGAPFLVTRRGKPLRSGATFMARKGDVLTLATTEVGVRGYLCVRGGFASRETLGSRSAWDPVRAGQELECPASTMHGRFLAGMRWLPEELDLLRVLPGSHAALFGELDFTAERYAVTPASNRMGLRLSGKPLVRQAGEMLSAPVCPGTVQVTNDGQLIILGVEAQTIGGYPRLAQVIRADLDKLAQIRPGTSVRFQMTDLETALRINLADQAELQAWVTRLQNSLS